MINRSVETAKVSAALDRALVGDWPGAQFLEFYGLVGIGKTTLLDHNCQQAIERGCLSARISAQGLLAQGAAVRLRLMTGLVDQLAPNYPPSMAYRAAVSEAQTALDQVPAGTSMPPGLLAPVTSALVDYLKALLGTGASLLLIFDDIDCLPENDYEWLTHQGLTALARFNRLVVVFAGRWPMPPELRTAEMMPGFSSDGVAPFAEKDTRKQLSGPSGGPTYAGQAPLVHSITHGLPLANDQAVLFLAACMAGGAGWPSAPDLARWLRAEIIDQRILAEVEPALHRVVDIAAYPRRFDPSLLHDLLSRYLPHLETYPATYHGHFRALNDLREAHLSGYDHREGAFRLDAVLVRLLQTCAFLLEPERYSHIHGFLAEWNLKQAARYPGTDGVRDVGDGLYHLSEHLRARVQLGEMPAKAACQELAQRFTQELHARLGKAAHEVFVQLDLLSEHLRTDVDLNAGLPGAVESLCLALSDYRDSRRPVPRAQLSLFRHELSLNVIFELPGRPIAINGRAQLATAAQPRLADMIADLDGAAKACRRLFNLCVPAGIRGDLLACQDPLLIQTDFATPVWELMHDGTDFMCLRLPVGRQLVVHQQPAQEHVHPRADRPRFLLVADPTDDLPAARREAMSLVDLLAESADVETLIGPAQASCTAFLDHLNQTAPIYDVIHFAGHVEFDPDRPQNSRLRFADSDCFPEYIERSLQYTPFMFFNACAAGLDISGEFHGGYVGAFTEGIAASAQLGGARGCLGPAWPVDDGEAEAFALAFYRGVLAGQPVGEAVRLARLESRRAFPASTAWAAYILHADPTQKLF